MTRITALTILGCGLCVSVTLGQTPGANYKHLEPIKGIIGKWKMSGKWEDGKEFIGEESSRWMLNKNFMASTGWFRSYEGKRVDYHIVTGWEHGTKQLVETFSFSDGGYARRVGVFDAKAGVWKGKEKGVDSEGKDYSFDVQMQFTGKNKIVWKGSNFKGPKQLPPLKFTFTRVTRAKPFAAAKTPAERALKSYANLAVGGVWQCKIDGGLLEDRYRRIAGGRFVLLTSNGAGGFPAGSSILGIDPATGKFTWWGYNADGSFSKGTTSKESKNTWLGQWESKGPKESARAKGRLTRVDRNTIKYEVLEQKVEGEAKAFPEVTVWKRRR